MAKGWGNLAQPAGGNGFFLWAVWSEMVCDQHGYPRNLMRRPLHDYNAPVACMYSFLVLNMPPWKCMAPIYAALHSPFPACKPPHWSAKRWGEGLVMPFFYASAAAARRMQFIVVFIL